MPTGKRVNTKELEEMLRGMLHLIDWQQQLVCSALDQLQGRPARRGKSPPHRRKDR